MMIINCAVALVFLLPSSMDAGSVTVSTVDGEEDEEEDQKKQKNSNANGDANEASWPKRVCSILGLVWLFLFVKIITSIANSAARSAQPAILKVCEQQRKLYYMMCTGLNMMCTTNLLYVQLVFFFPFNPCAAPGDQ